MMESFSTDDSDKKEKESLTVISKGYTAEDLFMIEPTLPEVIFTLPIVVEGIIG